MTKLPLAVGIADAVIEADREDRELDVRETASRLLKEYPEAEASFADIAAALADGNTPLPHG